MLSAIDVRKRPQAEDTRHRAWLGGSWLAWLASLAKLPVRHLLPMCAAVCVAGAVVLWLTGRYLDRPIVKLEVQGEFKRVAVGQVQAVVQEFRGAGFLSVDLNAVRTALQAIPWVDRARVTRHWPDGLEVSLTEHVPAVRWGEHGLLNARGELFLQQAQQVPLELPQLVGPDGTQQQVTRLYFEFAPQLLEAGLRIARMELDARGAWLVTLTNSVTVRLGRQDVRARLERLVRTASPLLAQQGGAIRYVDLRYSNGFSVGWTATAHVAQRAKAASSDG
jgi:cell division protein FtsQ